MVRSKASHGSGPVLPLRDAGVGPTAERKARRLERDAYLRGLDLLFSKVDLGGRVLKVLGAPVARDVDLLQHLRDALPIGASDAAHRRQ